MKIISCNLGQKKTYNWNGKTMISGIDKSPTNKPIFLGDEDVDGDEVVDRKYHGGIDQACYIYGKEQYEYWQKQYPDINWHYGFLGENITIDSLDESKLISGHIYKIGKAVVQITKPRNPCSKLNALLQKSTFVKEFWHAPYPGVYLKIIQNGFVEVGDNMELMDESAGKESILAMYQAKRKSKNIE